MNKKDLEKIFQEKEVVTIPEVQKQCASGYKEVRELFAELEKEKVIQFEGGLNFKYCLSSNLNSAKNVSKTEEPTFKAGMSDEMLERLKDNLNSKSSLFKDIVKYCAGKEKITVSELEKSFNLGYGKTATIMNWLKDMKVIIGSNLDERNVALTKEDYYKMFGEEKDDVIDGLDSLKNDGDNKSVNLEEILKELESKSDELLKHMESVNKSLEEEIEKKDKEYDEDCPKCDLWTGKEKQFEEICMDELEAIVKIKKTITKSEAIEIAKERLSVEKNPEKIQVFERVLYELVNSSEENFNKLRELIFS